MKAIWPSKIKGTIYAPASKSMMIRAIAGALLASGTSEIVNPSLCDDALTALDIAYMLGAEIHKEPDRVFIKGNGNLTEYDFRSHKLLCGESGLCIRMFTPIVAIVEQMVTLEAKGSLLLRPLHMVEELNALNVECKTNRGYAPVMVKGKLNGGNIHINGHESSQFLTGLLMVLPLCARNSTVTVSNLKSKPYINLTLEVMEKFGVNIDHSAELDKFYIPKHQRYLPTIFHVEGDWSSAAFFLVAGAMTGSIIVKGLNVESYQADKAIIEALVMAGASVQRSDGEVYVEKNQLNSFEFDASDSPDLFPPLVALASSCTGTSIIYGVDRLKYKESDRATALIREFKKLGINIHVFKNRMEVEGGVIKGGLVDSHNDHRIAMACAIAALNGKGIVYINRHECVAKSYPSFFDHLDSVRGAL